MSTTSAVPRYRVAEPAELDRIIGAHLAVFADEAVAAWVLRDGTGQETFARHYREVIEHSLRVDEILVAEEPDGALCALSVWKTLTSAERVRQEASAVSDFVTAGADSPYHRMAAVLTQTAERHPDEPHLYLASMGVVPEARGHGIGGGLLRHRLRSADIERQATYLEASTPRSQRLYARHGFRPLGPAISVAADGPRIQPMWRAPEQPAPRR